MPSHLWIAISIDLLYQNLQLRGLTHSVCHGRDILARQYVYIYIYKKNIEKQLPPGNHIGFPCKPSDTTDRSWRSGFCLEQCPPHQQATQHAPRCPLKSPHNTPTTARPAPCPGRSALARRRERAPLGPTPRPRPQRPVPFEDRSLMRRCAAPGSSVDTHRARPKGGPKEGYTTKWVFRKGPPRCP